MMPEKKPEAARFGVPGRTQIVGSRIPTPSMNPLAAVVGQQELCDGLLRAVTGCRRRGPVVTDDVGDGRAEHCYRRGQDTTWPIVIPRRPYRLQQIARRVEIDAIALLEADLGLAGHDCRQVKDHLGLCGDEIALGDVAANRVDPHGARRDSRRHDVNQRDRVDRLSAKHSVARQPLRSLRPSIPAAPMINTCIA